MHAPHLRPFRRSRHVTPTRTYYGYSSRILSTLLVLVIVLAALFYSEAKAQASVNPVWTQVGVPEKTYSRASVDIRNVGCVDFWFIGHDPEEAAYKCFPTGGYAQNKATPLPRFDPDGDATDTHGSAFVDLDGDGLKDLILVGGADRGVGTSWASQHRNVSSPTTLKFQRMDDTVVSDLNAGDAKYGRNRRVETFKWADGAIGLWTVTQGEPRTDGKPNISRVFKYLGGWKWVEVPDPVVNVPGLKDTCSVVADINNDGRDDLLFCGTFNWDGTRVGARLMLQQPNGSFQLAPLPFSLVNSRWLTAEIADLNGDGRLDIVASFATTTVGAGKVLIWHQQANATFTAQPQLTIATGISPNSIAVGKLSPSATLPGMYFANSDSEACRKESVLDGTITDVWPDQVAIPNGSGGYTLSTIANEPTSGTCSTLVTWVKPGLFHLAKGIEGFAGPQYTVRFSQ